jgi:hypothetical protein
MRRDLFFWSSVLSYDDSAAFLIAAHIGSAICGGAARDTRSSTSAASSVDMDQGGRTVIGKIIFGEKLFTLGSCAGATPADVEEIFPWQSPKSASFLRLPTPNTND